jgi:hypothetical protein
MAGSHLIPSDIMSMVSIGEVRVDEVMDSEEHREEPRSLSDAHMPPAQDEGSESEESDEGELGDASEYYENFEVINMDDEYESGEEYLEESCLRLIVILGHSMAPTAQCMITAARCMIPTIPALEYSDLDSESVSDYSDTEEGDSWSVISER